MNYIKEHGLSMRGGFSVYTKADMKTDMFGFVSCMAVDSGLQSTHVLPEGMVWYEVPGGKSLKVTHTGDYKYLPNSRSALYGASMNLKKKPKKNQFPYEKYITGPHTKSLPKDWVTEIYMPLK